MAAIALNPSMRRLPPARRVGLAILLLSMVASAAACTLSSLGLWIGPGSPGGVSVRSGSFSVSYPWLSWVFCWFGLAGPAVMVYALAVENRRQYTVFRRTQSLLLGAVFLIAFGGNAIALVASIAELRVISTAVDRGVLCSLGNTLLRCSLPATGFAFTLIVCKASSDATRVSA
jgi:hypothetical protein